MTITKERLQALIDNPIDERIMNYERSDILKMALSSIELHTDSLQNYRESLEAYQDYIKSLRAENTELKKEISRLKVDLADAETRKEDNERLLFLIENEYVVKQGIDSFWLAEPDGTSRIGSKCVTPIEAIDKYRKEHP
jgi:predicted RNase H-like nuclease (RuvC/YqgF family)